MRACQGRMKLAIVSALILISGLLPVDRAAAGVPTTYRKVAESRSLILYLDSEEWSIAIEDKRSAYYWYSSVLEDEYDAANASRLWKANVKSLLSVRYSNMTTRKAEVLKANPGNAGTGIVATPVASGVHVSFSFVNLGLEVSMELRLQEDALSVRIPFDEIRETGEYGIISLEPLPYLARANKTEAGYILYPDGSGALFHFKQLPAQNYGEYRWYVYGTDELDLDVQKEMRDQGLKQAMMPIYGVKRGENALLAILESGDFDSAVKFVPGGSAIDLASSISGEFTYRRFYRQVGKSLIPYYSIEEDMIRQDCGIRYLFLSHEMADYSGMAVSYRKHLVETGSLRAHEGKDEEIPLVLDLFMGIREKRLLSDKMVKMTTFREAEQILSQLYPRGIRNISLNLIGWEAGGYMTSPSTFVPDRALGGARDLRRLADYARERGSELYLNANLVDYYGRNGILTQRKNLVFDKNQTAVTNQGRNRFLNNPSRSAEYFAAKVLPRLDTYGIGGVCFEEFGAMLYHDYNERRPSSRGTTAMEWSKAIEATKGVLGRAAVQGGNVHMLKYADRLFDIPVDDSGFFLTDETIPFYQIVVHGMVPYSTAPVNLFHDFPRQKLKMVEYGSLPYFELTYRPSENLRNTEYNSLYSSYFGDWMEAITDLYAEFKVRLGATWSETIVHHERLGTDVYRITYGNGVRIYVNYREQVVSADGYRIGALGYTVVSREGTVL